MKVKQPSMLKSLLCHSEPRGRRISRRLFASLRVTLSNKYRNQKGFTLIEMLVVIALTGIIAAAATMAIHQVLTGTVLSNDQNTAINQVRNAGYWISRDALMAQSVNITGASDFPLTLRWTDRDHNEHQVDYTLEDMPSGTFKRLQRQETINDAQVTTTTVGQYIDVGNTDCHWDGEVLTVNITAQVGDKTETRTFQVKPRPD